MRTDQIFAGLSCLLLSAQVAVGVASSPDGRPGSERQARMAELDFMVGIWDLTRRESAAQGESVEWAGIRSCVWVLNRTAIRCDDRLSGLATNKEPARESGASLRESVFYVTYNESHGSYEILNMDASSAERSVYAARFDQDSQTLLKVIDHDAGQVDDSILSAIQTRVGDDQITEHLEWVSNGGQQLETAESVLRRKSGNPRDALFF